MVRLILKIRQNVRLWIQLIFTALTNGYVAGFLKGKIFTGKTKAFCVPGLNCYSCPGALGSCPIGSFQAVLGSRNYQFSFYLVGFFLLIGAVFGRVVCGFLCPFGLVQDLLYKIPFLKKRKNLPGDKYFRWLKYGILAGFVILLPLFAVDIVGQGQPWFCKYICPSGTLTAGIPLVASNPGLREAAGGLFAWKVFLLLVLLFLSVAVYRPFCKYLCPLGAIYGLFHPVAFYKFRVDKEKCTGCRACQRVCKIDIPVWLEPNSRECIRCGDCKRVCPTGAIRSTMDQLVKERKVEKIDG